MSACSSASACTRTGRSGHWLSCISCSEVQNLQDPMAQWRSWEQDMMLQQLTKACKKPVFLEECKAMLSPDFAAEGTDRRL